MKHASLDYHSSILYIRMHCLEYSMKFNSYLSDLLDISNIWNSFSDKIVIHHGLQINFDISLEEFGFPPRRESTKFTNNHHGSQNITRTLQC